MLYAKLIGGAAVMLIIYLGYTYVVNLQQENGVLKANEAVLQLANDVLVAEKKQYKENLAKSAERIADVNRRFDDAVEAKNNVIRLFADHDFTKLYNAKPDWITKKMNKATKKIFKEIEDASHAE